MVQGWRCLRDSNCFVSRCQAIRSSERKCQATICYQAQAEQLLPWQPSSDYHLAPLSCIQTPRFFVQIQKIVKKIDQVELCGTGRSTVVAIARDVSDDCTGDTVAAKR
jgi:hypothetical protein